ncbi:fimbrial protein [Pseudocitrobacter cyperus]|uniref:Fimbrial protein n=1 Tax=Pseudocitrobacter cyperus TaxID=3112843 RepID=A0ABV0HJC6_9ENTR
MKYWIVLWLMLAVAGAQAHDGRVNITGTIDDNTCTLSPDSQNFTVEMGQVSNRQFYHAGDGGAYVLFTINLEDCGSTASGVSVSFSGAADSLNPILLALTGGADSASGVGIALYNGDKTPVAPGDISNLQPLIPGQATARLNFYARYVADGATVTPGSANASATFVLNYA